MLRRCRLRRRRSDAATYQHRSRDARRRRVAERRRRLPPGGATGQRASPAETGRLHAAADAAMWPHEASANGKGKCQYQFIYIYIYAGHFRKTGKHNGEDVFIKFNDNKLSNFFGS